MAGRYTLNLSLHWQIKLPHNHHALTTFIEELDHLLDETYTSIESALLADDFVSKADQILVIPNIEINKSQVKRHDNPSDAP